MASAMKDVVQEIRLQNLTRHVRAYHGEGTEKFLTWLKDIDQLVPTVDSERMCILATITLGGSAGIFASRTLKENPGISWTDFRKKMVDRFSDLSDPFVAQERCRHLKQRPGESVVNFAERLTSAATEAFPDIQSPQTQRTLIEIFQRGVISDHLARSLIRKKFETLSAAVTHATEEQRAERAFEMSRNHLPPPEPMEIDVVRESDEKKRTRRPSARHVLRRKTMPHSTPLVHPLSPRLEPRQLSRRRRSETGQTQ